MTGTLLQKAPSDIWEHILDEFELAPRNDNDDYKSLSNFSIATSCPVILEMCRKRLFAQLDVRQPLDARAISRVFVDNKALVPYVKKLAITTGPPETRKCTDEHGDDDDGDDDEDYEDDDDDDWAHQYEESSDSEEDEDGIYWDQDENPFENDSILELLPKLTSVEVLTLEGHRRFNSERWSKGPLAVWQRFLSLPSIKSLTLTRLAWPIDLLGRSPNLENMKLYWIHIPFQEWDFAWKRHARGAFKNLRTLHVSQSDMMGVGLWNFLKYGTLEKNLKSSNLKQLSLETENQCYDYWAWIYTLAGFTKFGSNSLTELKVVFPFRSPSWNEFADRWKESSDKISGHLTQLQLLETFDCTFDMDEKRLRLEALPERDTAAALEPYLPSLIQGLVKRKPLQKSTLKHININITGTENIYLPEVNGLDDSGPSSRSVMDTDLVERFLHGLARAPIWRRLDTWISDDLPATGDPPPHLRILCKFPDLRAPLDIDREFTQPLLANLPKMRKANGVDIVLGH